ncbi:MAG TPA: ribose-5-phosphate isomerase RpiA [Clostridiaceae bacterium]|nr:ribose-5-phosphate isomerase RpiA [Clostridiaceae bacterium]
MTLTGKELQKKNAGFRAGEYIKDGMTLGLGTGSTAYYAIIKAGELVKSGYQLKAVATSNETARIAKENGIEILDLNDVEHIDLAIDGVDEIDGSFNAIKGGGGALFREKIVATLADEVIWIMDENKPVEAIGAFPLPVEILVYGYKHTLKQLADLGLKPVLRERNGETFVTDNGNYIADLQLAPPLDIDAVATKLAGIVGVLETGLFLNMCNRTVIGTEDSAKVIENPNKK